MRSIRYLSFRILSVLLFWLALGSGFCARAQSDEVQQLVLNVEKLSQLRNILEDMKKGYEIVSTGYNSVKNIAEGNFSLHEVFLDGLWLVSPEVRKYYKIAEIISAQKDLVLEYKSAFARFSLSGVFSSQELSYFSKVYGKLMEESLQALEELAMVITANKLRMSDEERLSAIDRIDAGVSDKLVFLRRFNRRNAVLQVQRSRELAELSALGNYFKR